MSYCTSSHEIQIQGNSLCAISLIRLLHLQGHEEFVFTLFEDFFVRIFFLKKIASKAISHPPFGHCLTLLVGIWIFTKKQSLKAKSLVNKPLITSSRIIVAPLIMQLDLVSDLENCRGQIWDDGLKVWKIVITHCYIGKYQASAENETKPPPCSR